MEQLKREKMFEQIFAMSPVGIRVVDLKNNILEVNKAYARLNNVSGDEIVGTKCDEWLCAKVCSTDDCMLKQIVSGVEHTELLYSIDNQYSNEREILLEAIPFRGEDDNVVGMLQTFTDITETQHMRTELIESQETLKFIYDNIDLILIMLDMDGNITFCNTFFLNLVGYSRQEVIGQNWFSLFVPDEKDLPEVFKKIIADSKSFDTYENKVLCKNGIHRLIRWKNIVYKDKDGQATGIGSIGEDITLFKESQVQLKKEIMLNKILVDISGEILQPENTIERIAGQIIMYAEELSESKDGQIFLYNGKQDTFFKLFSTFDFSKTCSNNEACLLRSKEPVIYNDQDEISTCKCSFKELSISNLLITPVYAGERLLGSIFLANAEKGYDKESVNMIVQLANAYAVAITRKEDEMSLRDAKVSAEEANKAKSDFLATMSHEIRTPMNSILGFAQILKNMEELPPDVRKYVRIIEQSGDNLLALINDILDFSKIEAGKIDLEEGNLYIRELFQDCYDMFSIKFKDKSLTFSYDIEKDVPDVLIGDRFRIEQVLINLVSNAYKFTEKGGVYLHAGYKNGLLQLSVKDTGIGIPEAQLRNIFNAFSQVDASTTRKYGGTGLGLAIVDSLIQRMQGNISVESDVNKGTKFFISIPISAVKGDIIDSDTNISTEPKQVYTSREKRLNVLIAEDNDMNFVFMQLLLEEEEVNYKRAVNGKDALQQLKNDDFDLLLLDMQMPVMGGEELLEILRQDNYFDNLYIVALTAHAVRGDKERYMHMGCNDYLSKPLKIDDLRRVFDHFSSDSKEITETDDKNSEIQDLTENIVDTEFFREELKRQLSLWKKIEGNFVIGEVKRFAEKLINIGENHGSQRVSLYAKRLYDAAENFDISQIEELMEYFPELTKELLQKIDEK